MRVAERRLADQSRARGRAARREALLDGSVSISGSRPASWPRSSRAAASSFRATARPLFVYAGSTGRGRAGPRRHRGANFARTGAEAPRRLGSSTGSRRRTAGTTSRRRNSTLSRRCSSEGCRTWEVRVEAAPPRGSANPRRQARARGLQRRSPLPIRPRRAQRSRRGRSRARKTAPRRGRGKRGARLREHCLRTRSSSSAAWAAPALLSERLTRTSRSAARNWVCCGCEARQRGKRGLASHYEDCSTGKCCVDARDDRAADASAGGGKRPHRDRRPRRKTGPESHFSGPTKTLPSYWLPGPHDRLALDDAIEEMDAGPDARLPTNGSAATR